MSGSILTNQRGHLEPSALFLPLVACDGPFSLNACFGSRKPLWMGNESRQWHAKKKYKAVFFLRGGKAKEEPFRLTEPDYGFPERDRFKPHGTIKKEGQAYPQKKSRSSSFLSLVWQICRGCQLPRKVPRREQQMPPQQKRLPPRRPK